MKNGIGGKREGVKMDKRKVKKFIKRYRFMTYGLILLIGIGMILYAGVVPNYSVEHANKYNILMGTGCGILSTVLVTVILLVLIPDMSDEKKELEEWGITKILNERNSIRITSKRMPRYILFFSAFGLSHFRGENANIENMVSKICNGLNVKILTIDPNSIYLLEQEASENNKIKKDIEDLAKWVEKIKSRCNAKGTVAGSIEIKFYDSLPLDFFCRADEEVFIGPYVPGQLSGETITYCYSADSKGGKYYINIFEKIWNGESTVLTSAGQGSTLYVNQEMAINCVLEYFCKKLQGAMQEKVIGVIAIFKGNQRRTFFSCNKLHEEKHVCHGKEEGTIGKLLEMNQTGSTSSCILFSDYKNKMIFAYKYEARKKNIFKIEYDINKLSNNEDTIAILAVPLFFNRQLIGALTFDFAILPGMYEASVSTLTGCKIGKEIDPVSSKALKPVFEEAEECGKIVINLLGKAAIAKYKTLYEEEW